MMNAPASDFAFGRAPTYSSDVGFMLAVSDDKKAFTATFSGLVVTIGPKSVTPFATRVFSFVLPVSDAAADAYIPFFVSGHVAGEDGANAHLVFSVNDRTTVADFSGSVEESFIHELEFKVGSAREVRLTVFLLADHDSKSDAQVSLNVTTIDTDLAKHKR
jgi:hypothetical protein